MAADPSVVPDWLRTRDYLLAASGPLSEQSTNDYRQALTAVAEHLRDKGLLRTDVEKAVDELWFCFGFGAWRTLVKECGWSWDDAERWLARQAITIFTH